MKLTLEEIQKYVYGERGLLDRIVDEIKTIGYSECVDKTSHDRQYFWDIVNRHKKNKHSFKITTIYYLSKILGVD